MVIYETTIEYPKHCSNRALDHITAELKAANLRYFQRTLRAWPACQICLTLFKANHQVQTKAVVTTTLVAGCGCDKPCEVEMNDYPQLSYGSPGYPTKVGG